MKTDLQPFLIAEAGPAHPYVVCVGIDNIRREEPVELVCKRQFTDKGEWYVKVRFQNGATQFIDVPRIVNCPDLRTIREGW